MNNVYLWKHFLFRCFLVSFVFLVVVSVIWFAFQVPLCSFSEKYFGLSAKDYQTIVIYFISIAKFITYYVFLIPAIALHFMPKGK